MTDWKQDLWQLLTEEDPNPVDDLGHALGVLTPDPVEPLLRGGAEIGARVAGGALGSWPVQTFGRVMSVPQDVAKYGTGALLGGINRAALRFPNPLIVGEPGTEAAFSTGGPRAAWEEVRSDEPNWFQLPTEIGIDPLNMVAPGARAGALAEAAQVARTAGRPYAAGLAEAGSLGLRGIQAYNDAPGKLLHNAQRLPPGLGGGEVSLQGAVRGIRSGVNRVLPSALEESARSARMNLQDDLLDIANAKARPRPDGVIGTREYNVDLPVAHLRSYEDVVAPLRAQLDQLGLSDVAIRLVNDLRTVNPNAGPNDQALYRGSEKLIAISLGAAKRNELPGLIDHEAIHALRNLGTFADDEWRVLLQTATDMGLGGRVGGLYPEANADRLAEEMVAALYTAYRSGTPVPEQARTILQKIGDFFRRLGGVAPQVAPKEVLRRIDAGEVGSRSRAPILTDLDSFARRKPDPAAQRIRDYMVRDGIQLTDRDPTLFERFRAHVEGREPADVVRTLSAPVTKPGTPSLRQVVPDWDQQSARRLQNAIAWAARPKSEGGWGPDVVATALAKVPELAPPPADLYDLMLKMPIGHILWYDLSGLSVDEIAGMTPEQARKYVQYIAGTSPGETPYTNLKLATAVMSEDLRGRPGWVGMRNTSQVERVSQGVGLGGPKTDDFAMEIAQRSRALRDPEAGATPVIDLWQARAYHLPDAETVGKSDPLFAIIARHTIEDSDALQRAMGPYLQEFAGAPLVIEPRMTQAGLWVLGRENEGMYDKDLQIPDFTRGSDYWSAARQMEAGLAETVPSVAEAGGRLTVRNLIDPAIANELTNYGVANYEEGRHVLTEFATSNTLPGVRAQEILLNVDQLPSDHPVRGKILNGWTTTAAERAAGAPNTVPGINQITRGLFKDAAESKVFAEMAAALMRIPPGKLDLGRINYRAYGSWGGVISPHIDIPTTGRVGSGDLVHFPKEVIERMAMGIAQAWRQDMAAINAWSTIGVNPAEANARIIYLPDVHFDEQVGGSIKAIPAELARAAEVTRAMGWPTQVVNSPLMSMIKLIDPRDPKAPPLGDQELYAALDRAGYTGRYRVIDAVHTSTIMEANPEVGYAHHITNPNAGRGQPGGITDHLVFGESGTYPPHPVGGRVPETDWGGEPRLRFRDATARLRERADAATARLADAERWQRELTARTVGQLDLPWKVDPALATRARELAETPDGVAPNFPMGEDAFARVAARALGTTPDDPAAALFASLDPRLDESQNALLRNNTLKDGRTWDQALEEEAARIGDDLARVAASGVTWGSRATPQERLDAAQGMPEVQKIIKRYNDEKIDLMAAQIENPYTLASYNLVKTIDKETGRDVSRRTNYDLFRAMWAEQALFSPKYHAGNLTGGMIQNAIADVYTNPVRTAKEVLHAFKLLRGGSDVVTTREARESMLSWTVARRYGFDPPVALMRGGVRSMSGEAERARTSAMGEAVARATRSERAGRIVGAPFAASNDLGTSINTAVREPVWIQTFEGEMEARLPEWVSSVRDRLRAAGDPTADDFQFEDLESLDPGLLKPALVARGLSEGVAEHLSRTFVQTRSAANKEALRELDRVQFYGTRTNLDEWVGKVVPFHYWFSRAIRYYGEAALNNPSLGLSYLRAADGIEDAQHDPGLSARQKGFLRLLGTSHGFSLLMNPDALFGVVKVFGLNDTYDPDGQTQLGGALDWMKQRGFGIYPWVDGTLNLMGIYGNTFEPDLLGIRHKALVGAAAQWVRAHAGFDPAAAPYAEGMGQARYAVSSFVSDVLPWLSEPVTPRVGGSSQEASLDTLIESVIVAENPNLTNDELLVIMSDPDHPEFEKAYRAVADAGLVQQLLNFSLPVQSRVKHDATDVRRAQIEVVAEEAERQGVMPWELAPTGEDLAFAAKHEAMTGKQWDPGDYAKAKLEQDLVRAPQEAKPFLLQEWSYNELGTPEQRDHFDRYQALLDGTDPATAGRSEGVRRELAYQYMDRHRGAGKAVDEVRRLKAEYQATHPEFAEFKQWQGRMYSLREQFGGSLAEYRRQASAQNPNAARYFTYLEERVMREEPQEEWLSELDRGTASASAWQAITGQGQARSAPGPVPGFPRADITLPNLMPATPPAGAQAPDWAYRYGQSGQRSGAGVY